MKGGLECEGVRAAAASGGVWNSLKAIGAAEGIRGYWRGNLPQVRSPRSPFLSLKGSIFFLCTKAGENGANAACICHMLEFLFLGETLIYDPEP